MMTFIQNGQGFLNRTLAEAAGVSVTYMRPGASQSATLAAWVGRTVFRQVPAPGQPGAQVIHGERDYLIPVASLVLGGVATVPARGDRITEAGVGTFELLAPGGEPIWRYSDQTRTVFRVHCKRVS